MSLITKKIMGLRSKRKLVFDKMNNCFKEIQNYLRDSMYRFGDFKLPFKYELASSIVPVRMKEEDDSYTVQVLAPGYNKEELKVTIENADVLVISGKRSKDESYEDNEFFTEKFERKVALNNDIDYQKVKVELKNGILSICLPKKETKDKNEITFKIDD